MLRCSASTQHGTTDLILFLKDRRADTGEPAEIYLPDVPKPAAHTEKHLTLLSGWLRCTYFFPIQIVCLIRTFGRFDLLNTSSPHSWAREVNSPDSRDPNTKKTAAREHEKKTNKKKNPMEEQKVRAGLIVTLDLVDFYADSLTCLAASLLLQKHSSGGSDTRWRTAFPHRECKYVRYVSELGKP